MHAELDQFVFAEVAPKVVIHGIVDSQMVGGEQVGEANSTTLRGRQILCLRGLLQ
jgi:hypothetical protein